MALVGDMVESFIEFTDSTAGLALTFDGSRRTIPSTARPDLADIRSFAKARPKLTTLDRTFYRWIKARFDLRDVARRFGDTFVQPTNDQLATSLNASDWRGRL